MIFFPVKAEMLLFLKIYKGDHKGDHPKPYFTLKLSKFLDFFIFVNFFNPKYILRWSPLWSPLYKFEKYNISAFTGKKNHAKILKTRKFRCMWISMMIYLRQGFAYIVHNPMKSLWKIAVRHCIDLNWSMAVPLLIKNDFIVLCDF